MCGLVGGVLGSIDAGMEAISHRGPDADGIARIGPFTLGHVRLAIQDLSHASDQPFDCLPFTVTYNGELWNPEWVKGDLKGPWTTKGDTEVVARALATHGVSALPMLDGMWALAWADADYLYLARDPYGEVPLHYGWTRDKQFVYASEVAALLALGAHPATIQWVEPGTYLKVSSDSTFTRTRWVMEPDLTPGVDDGSLRDRLMNGSVNRMTSDAPVAVLASGGLDSSAILALLVERGYRPTTYTAVYDKTSQDYKHAKAVTSHLGLDLIPVQVPEPTRKTVTEAIQATEMPHKAQIEIALACLELAKVISGDGFKVVLSGEGSDELWGSYGMAYHGIKRKGWHRYRWEEFYGQHRKNFARTNKVFMRHGVEARLPFLHDPLVRFGLRQTQQAVTQGRHVKAILASAVDDAIPHRSAWRTKAAFQTEARLDKAAAKVVADPTRFYRAEHSRLFSGVKP